MATRVVRRNVAYGYATPQALLFPDPINLPRDPSNVDQGLLGQTWINTSASTAFILVQIANGLYTWQPIQAGGGAGVFSSLTVTGASTLTGTTQINASGAAATFIGNGTGNVTIGNPTAGVATNGDLTVSGGSVIVATGGEGVRVNAGTVGVGASPLTLDARAGQASYSDVIAGSASGALVLNNNLITGISQINANVSCATAGAILVIGDKTVGVGTVTFTVYNVSSSTATADPIIIDFQIIN